MGDETPKKAMQSSFSAPSSIPKPNFLPEPKCFSTKKQRGTPPPRPPPRPQPKTCPPISRVFKRRQELFAAQSVTFVDSGESDSLRGTPLATNDIYDKSNKLSYFEQAFTIQEKIGAGCFGTVYKVKSKEDGRLYAVKIARERYKGVSDRKEKLEEVRKHQYLLPHPNCVHFYQSWEDNGRLYQKFELCQKSLLDISEENHDVSESLIWAYLVDLLLAVQHLHDHDLIHMDIKPENIFIGMDGICKLGDFGLVIDLAKGTSKAVEGDPRYLATEVLQDRKFTKAADIFALGVSILELAADLDLPKHGTLWHQLRQTGPDPNLTRHLSQDLRQVIQLMMLNDDQRRPNVKQLLELGPVKKAKNARARQLWINQCVQSVQSTCTSILWPIVTLFWALIAYLFIPYEIMKTRLRRFYFDSRMSTPIQQVNGGFVAPYPKVNGKSTGVSFSSDEEDFSVSSSQNSVLASPLQIDFSDEDIDNDNEIENEKDPYSPSHPRRSKRRNISRNNSKYNDEEPLQPISRMRRRNMADQQPMSAPHIMGPPNVQSTPKTTAAERFRKRYDINDSPTFSPKKKLDFDSFNEIESSNEGSPKLKKAPNFEIGTPSSSKNGGGLNSSTFHEESHNMVFNSSNSANIKPVILASKFDCFSDSD